MQRKYKLSLWTNDSIEEITTMIITTIVTIATPCTTATDRNHAALCVIRKDVTYRNIPKRSKKSLRLNLRINLRTAFRSK